jgi:flagellar biogenesis protein FliO
MLTSLASLGVAVALVLLVGWSVRSLGLGRYGNTIPRRPRSLTLVDTIALDSRRRLSLVACRESEVLVLTGSATDQLVVLRHRRNVGEHGP